MYCALTRNPAGEIQYSRIRIQGRLIMKGHKSKRYPMHNHYSAKAIFCCPNAPLLYHYPPPFIK